MDPLNREAAPFPPDIWGAIDEAAVAAARAILTARRFLPVEGPFGLGLTSVEAGGDDFADRPDHSDAAAIMAAAVSVPMLWKNFVLSRRRLAAHAEHGQPLDLTPVVDAAEAVARLEERLIYLGDEKARLAGLLTGIGSLEVSGGDWSTLDRALADVLKAVTLLDERGYRGPYALVAAPALYNGLFRRYEGSDILQVEHLGRLCAAGVHKAPIEGAAVVDPRAGRLVVGQDLAAGLAWSDGIHARLFLTESLVLKLDNTGAVCRISPPAPAPASA